MTRGVVSKRSTKPLKHQIAAAVQKVSNSAIMSLASERQINSQIGGHMGKCLRCVNHRRPFKHIRSEAGDGIGKLHHGSNLRSITG